MPALSPDGLARHLAEGGRGGVFFLFGEEEHLRESAVRRIVDAHLDPGARDFNLDEVRGSDTSTETLGSLVGTPPMLGAWRVVVVRDAQHLAISATARTLIEATVAAPPPGLALVLSAEISASKAKLWTSLKKRANAVEFARLSEADLPGWLMAWARRESLELEPDAARGLVAAVGSDLGTALREMEKLRDYVGDRSRITRADVEKAVGLIPRQDRWEWIDAVAERRFEEARSALPVLLDLGETGVGLVIGLGTQFLRLALFVAGGRPLLEAELPQHQRWLARRIPGQARRWTIGEIDRAIAHLRRADRLLKSAPLRDIQVMEELLLRLQHDRQAAA